MVYNYNFKLRVVKCMTNKLLSGNMIRKVFNVSNGSMYNWKSKLANGTLNNCKTRVSKITPNIKCYIRQYVISRKNFNYRNLITMIKKKYNVIIGKSSIYNILNKFKIKKKKIYVKTCSADKDKRKQLIHEFKNKLKSISVDDIISMDECSIDSHINHNYGWALKGKKLKVYIKHNRIRYTVLCAVSNTKVIHVEIISGSANAIIFKDFMKKVFSKLSRRKKSYILLDNARIHHAKIFKEYMQTIKSKELIYNVPYSPESNPIEKVFGETKKYLRDTKVTNINLKNEINKAFGKIPKKNLISYFNKSMNYY